MAASVGQAGAFDAVGVGATLVVADTAVSAICPTGRTLAVVVAADGTGLQHTVQVGAAVPCDAVFTTAPLASTAARVNRAAAIFTRPGRRIASAATVDASMGKAAAHAGVTAPDGSAGTSAGAQGDVTGLASGTVGAGAAISALLNVLAPVFACGADTAARLTDLPCGAVTVRAACSLRCAIGTTVP